MGKNQRRSRLLIPVINAKIQDIANELLEQYYFNIYQDVPGYNIDNMNISDIGSQAGDDQNQEWRIENQFAPKNKI